MLPLNSSHATEQAIDRYEVEPYVFAEYVTSPDHPTQGQASHSWLTGTAVWMFRIGVDQILGFRPALEGMYLDPHIPADWSGFKAERKFRGKLLRLTVTNPDRHNSGVCSMVVNGVTVNGNLLNPTDYDADTLEIEITLS